MAPTSTASTTDFPAEPARPGAPAAALRVVEIRCGLFTPTLWRVRRALEAVPVGRVVEIRTDDP